MASWPSTLPSPKLDSYGFSPADQTVRTDMEGGNVRSRRRTTTRNDVFQVSWIFDQPGMASFRSWFDNSSTGANGGQAWFSCPIMTGYSSSETNLDCRFASVWKASYKGKGKWEVSASLEVRYA